MSVQAMQMALELLQEWNCASSEGLHRKMLPRSQATIAALTAALAQEAGQQPVAHHCVWRKHGVETWRQYHDDTDPMPEQWNEVPDSITPLFTTPPTLASAIERTIEAAAKTAEGFEKNRDWVPGSLYDTLRRETASAIRALSPAQVLAATQTEKP